MIGQQFKAVIFDMDGTLVDNMAYHQQAWIGYFKSRGLHITPEEYEEKNYGIITEIVPRFFDRQLTTEEITQYGEEKETFYRQLYAPHMKPVDGLIPFLEKLKQQDIRIGLATAANRPNIDFVLDGLRIEEYFSVITGGEEVKKGKPDPEVFLTTARNLKVDPADCLVVEDSVTGIKAGLAAHMKVMAVATTHTVAQLEAYPLYRIVSSYEGL